MAVQNTTNGQNIAKDVKHCRSLWDRTKGLLGTKELKDTEACWLVPCSSIHTFGMRYAIDAYFLNKKNKVVGIMKNMKPNRMSPLFWGAYSVLEFSASDHKRCAVGDELRIEVGHENK
jgi:uncharacterized protein